jgi:hypothetical protein
MQDARAARQGTDGARVGPTSGQRDQLNRGLTTTALLLAMASASAAGDTGGSSAFEREARVVNGVIAQDRPTTGALLQTSGTSYWSICSGTLIGCGTFVTAAHCVCEGLRFEICDTPDPADFAVYLQDVGIAQVAAIEVDPSFLFEDRGDVAVLTLASPVTGVSPTPINTDMRPPLGTEVEMAGFGLTRGGAADTGMLRRGLAETAVCTSAAPDYHVCWEFASPFGAAGLDSNTCNGDSGGPLFADLGSGTSLVGITSGGTTADCLPTDKSFDTDVLVHAPFIEGVAGADLLATSCGSIAQVGEPGATRHTFDFDTYQADAQACRRAVARSHVSYAIRALAAWQSCFDEVADGSRTGPCPDADTLDALAEASDKVSLAKLEARCPDGVATTIGAQGVCAASEDAADLATCILSAGDAAVSDALASEYANDNPAGPIAGEEAADCQRQVARATHKLLKSSLKAATRCQASLAAGKVAECPDEKSAGKIANAETRAAEAIVEGCSDAAVQALDAAGTFGGTCSGQTSAGGLASCELVDHAAVRDSLVALLVDQQMETDLSFTVPPGTAVLRVTLNGKDSGTNDLDVYLRHGAPATKLLYDEHSENGGMFEEIEIASPSSGTWHVHIDHYAGETLIPYQLTATSFLP